MKANLVLWVFLSFNTLVAYSQDCESFSLGQLFAELKALKYQKQDLKFARHGSFDFVSFKPVGEGADLSSYVDVGYDGKNTIHEIIIHSPYQVYALEVHDSKEHKILLLKLQDPSDRWLFTSVAILLSRCGNYMLNVRSVFEKDYDPYELFDFFPITTFQNISCLMSLREDLYPYEFVRFSEGRIVTYSGLKYEFEKSSKLELEAMHFFIGSNVTSADLSIRKSTNMKEVIKRSILLRTKSNLIVFTKPKMFESLVSPLWIMGGAHSYFMDN